MHEEIIESIKNLYSDLLFKDNFVDKKTGGVTGANKKLATFPFIGSNYGLSKKILFIGLDMGEDETPQEIQTFEMRNHNLENSRNNHISGTFFTALYFLQEDLKAENLWNNIVRNGATFKQSFKKFNELNLLNPISYACLSNYYKFVTKDRKGRSGDLDRKHINEEIEELLFIKEIEILDPKIIIFQSVQFNNGRFSKMTQKLIAADRKVYIGPHPSHRGTKIPQKYINLIREIK